MWEAWKGCLNFVHNKGWGKRLSFFDCDIFNSQKFIQIDLHIDAKINKGAEPGFYTFDCVNLDAE